MLNTEQELDFLKLGQKSFSDNRPYWIKGSTDRLAGYTFSFSTYFPNDNGTVCIHILTYFTNVLMCVICFIFWHHSTVYIFNKNILDHY